MGSNETIIQRPVQDSIEAIWEVSVDELVPIYSWVSSAYWWKDTMLFWFDWSECMTFATGDMKTYLIDNNEWVQTPEVFFKESFVSNQTPLPYVRSCASM